ncbi:hypothetical protein OG730_37410 [Streptomyces sp. NBC_01298]|uniref:hypothetical protein n=1 Tax=Streptomyces sp. NBC_01298 TaxID=2903817 RepID=UPI002E0EEC05|nr:hypothetical protein OG730_37410 [Streptomyces sp. NBC_01298]
MRKHDDTAGRATDPVLTAEDLARPAPAGYEDALPSPDEAVDEQRRRDAGRVRDAGKVPGSRPGGEFERTHGAGQEPGPVQRDVLRDAPDPDPTESVHAAGTEEEPLLGTVEADGYRARWGEIQGLFVDDPQEAVRSADTLVAEVMQAFAETLSAHRSGLEKQWDSGEQVATEDLRQALQAYRALVNRLLDT